MFVLAVCCREGIVQAKLHCCIWYNLQEGDGDAVIEAADALLTHDSCRSIHHTAVHLHLSKVTAVAEVVTMDFSLWRGAKDASKVIKTTGA